MVEYEEEVLEGRLVEEEDNYADALWLNLDLPTSIVLLQFVEPSGNSDWTKETDHELGKAIGAFRHVRNYPSSEIHGDSPDYIGVRQLWWPTLSAFESGVRKNPEAFKELLEQAGQSFTTLTKVERFLR